MADLLRADVVDVVERRRDGQPLDFRPGAAADAVDIFGVAVIERGEVGGDVTPFLQEKRVALLHVVHIKKFGDHHVPADQRHDRRGCR